jgi:predicted Zn-dependent protease
MSSTGESAGQLADLLKRFQSLYDCHRFLDLYSLTSGYWNSSTDVDSLPVDALVLGGRLAERLGGLRLSRWLLRRAFQRDPANPRVRYFTRGLNPLRMSLLDELKAFTDNPDIGGEDMDVRASWYASFAYSWAVLRDFDRAYDCMRVAHSLFPNDSWMLSCESEIHGMADRWTDALRSAESALEADPHAPFSFHSLGIALVNLGRVEEAAARLSAEAESCQYYWLVIGACWHQCALAETLDGEQRRTVLDGARKLAARLPDLMPLADRESLKSVARANLDIAVLADDYAEIERWISEVHSPYHRQLLANLARNAKGKRIRLHFRRFVQKHAACLPTSITAAMSAGGMNISADEMASDITFGGTAEWAAADWLRARGYYVRFFSATPEVAAGLIRNQIAFIIILESEESGHAVAVVGIDERAETILVHDPQSFRSSEYLLRILDPLSSPLGIIGMAVVRPEHAILLDSLLPPESAVMTAAQEQSKQGRLHGLSAARQAIANLPDGFSAHPGARYLEAVQLLEDGQVGQALGKLTELLRQFPKSPPVRVRFISACRALGDTALLRQALKDIVEEGILPGLEAKQDWIFPPGRYVYEYADLLRLSNDTRDRAESLLISLIRRQANSAGAWHNLADLLWTERDIKGALLSYGISSCLDESNEHFAGAYADALHAERREEDGFQWLESRVRRFQDSPYAVSTWITWISTLEARGHPERALAACNEALAQNNTSAQLLSFAVPFFARMGDWTRADAELGRLRDAGLPHAFFEASTRLHQMRGDLEGAARSATAWIAELPHSINARYSMLGIISESEGEEAAVRISLQWMRENKDHEDFEEAYCAQLDRALATKWRKYSVILRRLRRNPEDAWAWRELTFTCLYQYNLADDRKRKRLEPRITRYLDECDRTSAGAVQTVRAHALWDEYRGDWAAAVAGSLKSIELDPEVSYSYLRAWECSSRLKAGEREDLWSRMEPMLVNSPGRRLPIAREIMRLLAERFGVAAAEKSMENWKIARPEDPDILEAAADLLIEHGHGRSDAVRAIAMLEPAVLRYPYHSGLFFSLANAYRRAGRDPDAEVVLAEIARRHPDSVYARIQLAWIKQRKGDAQGAFEILDAAMAAAPRDATLLDARVQILIENARFDEAIPQIEDGLCRLPMDVNWRRWAIALFIRCGADDKAIQAARDGVEAYPRGAYLWLMLGGTLNKMRRHAEVGEIESCLRKSLELNCALFEAADLLSILLTEQRRYDDATKIMLDIEPRMADPSPANGRLAWIRRQRGQRSEAVTDLANVLTAAPWDSWGWDLLMDWLEEDAARDLTHQLLQNIPPPMYTNTSFRLRRLLLLEGAKVDTKQLDGEWDTLLRDFPEDVSLHARRYDNLIEATRWQDASAVIDSIAKVEPDNPFILARRCEMLSLDNKKDEALDIAMRICFLPVEEHTWPSENVWSVARSGGFAERLHKRFSQHLLDGNKPTLNSFSLAAAYVMRHSTKVHARPRITAWFPCRGARELIRLFNEVTKAPWNSSEYRALIYGILCDYGYHGLAIRLSARIDPASVTTVSEWAEIGRAFVGCHLYAKARKLFKAWRERTGVAMWMISNYIISLSRINRDQLQERYNSSRDALAGLPHDHCAKYLAHLQAEACALLDNKDDFLSTWKSLGRYFDGKLEKGEYFKTEDFHLLTNIPKLAKYLMDKREVLARILFWKLWLRRIREVPRYFS